MRLYPADRCKPPPTGLAEHTSGSADGHSIHGGFCCCAHVLPARGKEAKGCRGSSIRWCLVHTSMSMYILRYVGLLLLAALNACVCCLDSFISLFKSTIPIHLLLQPVTVPLLATCHCSWAPCFQRTQRSLPSPRSQCPRSPSHSLVSSCHERPHAPCAVCHSRPHAPMTSFGVGDLLMKAFSSPWQLYQASAACARCRSSFYAPICACFSA